MSKTLKWILIPVLSLLIIACLVFMVILPTTFNIDETLIKANDNYSVELVEDEEFTTLKKTTNEEFKVMAFTDMHLDGNKEEGEITLEMMIRNIVKYKPDFVVLNGDCITAAFTGYRAHQLCKIFEKLGVYWTYTLGNHEHDNDFCMTRDKLMALFASYEHCVANVETKTLNDGTSVYGYSNDVINLQNKDGDLVQSLILFDGGQDIASSDAAKYEAEYTALSLNPGFAEAAQRKTAKSAANDKNPKTYTALDIAKSVYEYEYIKATQVTWYKETIAKLKAINANVKSTIFSHIPFKEMLDAYVTITGNEYIYYSSDNTIETPTYNTTGECILEGNRRENVCCSIVTDENNELWSAIKTLGSTQAVFCGHDHVNDFSLLHNGIIMGYVQPSGYSSYNVLSNKQGTELIQGCSIYAYANDGTITCNDYLNNTLEGYSDLKAYIHSTVRH